MADYIYLLENRLSKAQQAALKTVREVARAKELTVFLVGGAVRDLISGSPVRDLDLVVQGNALKLKKDLEKLGIAVSGESETGQALFLRFPGGVRMELGSTLSMTFPKPGKPLVTAATILDDLRRRDFTANAMALSLNDGSYGLLMDPLNGVADIENRELRLVSNYGFIEDPVRMIRAARYMARLGWQLDEKTQARYETGKQEGYISAMGDFQRGYETEEIFHEEDPLRVLKRLESEGWMQHLFPTLSATKANVTELERLRESQTQLQMQGIHPEAAAANFPFLTAKMAAKEIAELKKSFVRQGFVAEIEALEDEAKEFAAQFSAKTAAAPSQAWKLLHAAKPESVLWVAHSNKSGAVQARFKGFFTEWAQAKQKIPYVLMQEMRIVPELPGYDDLLDKLFFELMDGKLSTVEEMRAYLEPYSPPAPPPPVHLRRARTPKKDAKPGKSRKKAAAVPPSEDIEATTRNEDTGPKSEPPTKPAKAVIPAKPVAPAKNPATVKVSAPVKASVATKVPTATKAVVPAKSMDKKTTSAKTSAKPAQTAGKAPTKKPIIAKASVKYAVKKVVARTPAKKFPAKPFAKKAAVKVAPKKATAKPVLKKSSSKPVPKKTASKPAVKKKVPTTAKKTIKVTAKKRR